MVTAEVPTRYVQHLTPVLMAFLPRAVTNALVPALVHTLTHSPLQVVLLVCAIAVVGGDCFTCIICGLVCQSNARCMGAGLLLLLLFRV